MRAHLKNKAISLAGLFIALSLVVGCAIVRTAAPAASAFTAGDGSGAVSAIPSNRNAYVPGQLIVGLSSDVVADGATADDMGCALESLGFDAVSLLACAYGHSGPIMLVEASDGRLFGDELAQAASRIAHLAGVDYVQPNYRYAASEAKAADMASDEDVPTQWYLDSWADSHGANVGEAWGKVKASPDRKVDVAVLDTGVYVMQEYDSTGKNLIVSDDNFHQEFDSSNLDLTHAVDFVHSVDNNSPLPLVNESNPFGDDNGHGTHISAIIAANAQTAKTPENLPEGMAGVSQNARVIPLKVLDAGGQGDTADFISAYSYLLENAGQGGVFENLRVINMSLSLTFDEGPVGGDAADEGDADDAGDTSGEGADDDTVDIEVDEGASDDNTAFRSMIKRAEDAGIVTVCAAGNEGKATATYPSDYEECVSVVALDAAGATSSFSNVNRAKDISAPGVDIYSAWGAQGDAYATLSGTSQATAIVSGVLTMLWADKPALSVSDAKAAIYNTAHHVADNAPAALRATSASADVGAGSGPGLSMLSLQSEPNGSHGAIDAAAALSYVAGQGKTEPGTVVSTTPGRLVISKDSVKLQASSFVYTGKPRTPTVSVVVSGKTLAKGTDYTVQYRNSVNPGTGKVIITGKGIYAGEVSKAYAIKLGTAKIKKLKAAKKAASVQWSRQKSGSVGYQVRYSLKKTMKSAKVKSIAKNKTTKTTIAKLKSGKKYYVQVRTFKKIKGKAKYSAWSAKKTVKVK